MTLAIASNFMKAEAIATENRWHNNLAAEMLLTPTGGDCSSKFAITTDHSNHGRRYTL